MGSDLEVYTIQTEPLKTEDAAQSRDSRLSSGFAEQFMRSLQLWRFWIELARSDWQKRYRRSLLGASWVFVSFALFIGVKIVIFGAISQQEMSFFAVWVSVGFLVWSYISSNMIEGCNVFIASSQWIKGTDLPYLIYVYQSVVRNIIQFALSMGVIIIVLVFAPPPNLLISLTSILALFIYIANALWCQLLLAVVSARFRDVIHLVQTVVRLLFFLTPILWVPVDFGILGVYAKYNPFTHYIAIMREPLITGVIPWKSWLAVLLMTLVGSLVALVIFARNRKRIVFWV